jgi:hypothetical protein
MNEIFFQNAHVTVLVLRRKLGEPVYGLISTPRYAEIAEHRWHAARGKDKKSFYARTNVKRTDGKWRTLLMHQVLLGHYADHADRDGLNNQDYNLRTATGSQNSANRGMMKNSKSGHRGVWWSKRSQKWQTGVRVSRKMIHGGYFDKLEDAVSAVDSLRKQCFGEYA